VRMKRFMSDYKLPAYDAAFLTSEKSYADFFETALDTHNNTKGISNLIMTELMRHVNDKQCEIYEAGITPENLAEIVKLLDSGTISGNISKKLFEEVLESGKKPSEIVEEKGMAQNSDEGELEKIVQQIIDANPDEAERFRAGDKKLQGFFMGQIMRASKGKANPGVVSQLLNKLIK